MFRGENSTFNFRGNTNLDLISNQSTLVWAKKNVQNEKVVYRLGENILN